MIAQLLHAGDGSTQLHAAQFGHQHRLDQRVLAGNAVLRRHLTGAVPHIYVLDALGALHEGQ